jgi:hypothetical protein
MDFPYLDSKAITLEPAPDGTLRVVVPGERCGLRVEAIRAFPLLHPEENIVLRDGGGAELGVIRNLSDLPEAALELVRDQLHRRYFLPRIQRIIKIQERFGMTQWEIETDRGYREVASKPLHEAIFEIEPGRYLITDNESNRYEIPNLSELDAPSRAQFLGKS